MGRTDWSTSPLIGVCHDCGIYWPCDDDNCVPICPQDTSEDRSHFVTVYREDPR